jgi:TPR repeat protein
MRAVVLTLILSLCISSASAGGSGGWATPKPDECRYVPPPEATSPFSIDALERIVAGLSPDDGERNPLLERGVSFDVIRPLAANVRSQSDAATLLEVFYWLWLDGDPEAALAYAWLFERWPDLRNLPKPEDAYTFAATRGHEGGYLGLAATLAQTSPRPPDFQKRYDGFLEQARALLHARLIGGDCRALIALADIEADGLAGKSSPAKARRLLEFALTKRVPGAATKLADFYLNGVGGDYASEAAIDALKQGREDGDVDARWHLARLALSGPLSLRDRGLALPLLEELRGQESYRHRALLLLARDAAGMFGGDPKKDDVDTLLAEALARAATSAERLAVADLVRIGLGTFLNRSEIVELYAKEAERGSPEAMLAHTELRLLEEGPGDSSLIMVRDAATAGHLPSIRRLLGLALSKEAEREDLDLAEELLAEAADRGDEDAALILAGWRLAAGMLDGDQTMVQAAAALLQPFARSENVLLLQQLGHLHASGLLAEGDAGLAGEVHKRALDISASSPRRMAEVAGAFAAGHAQTVDQTAAAFQWYKRCADLGWIPCHYGLARLALFEGRHVNQAKVETAHEALATAAKAGDVQSMVDLAKLEPRREDRTAWLERASVQGSIEGMLGLATDLVTDPERSDQALTLLHRAKAQAMLDIDRAVAIGRIYQDGQFVSKDMVIARRWFERAAVAGNPVAMREMGLEALNAADDGRLDQGTMWLTAAVMLGDVVAMEALASLYRSERHGQPDLAKALRLDRLAAYYGSKRAMIRVATALERGIGAAPQPSAAEDWRLRAAANGDVDAMVRHGRAIIEQGGEDLGQEGTRLLARAAERHHESALLALGQLHLEGRHVEQDQTQAQDLIEAAAERGSLEARLARLKLTKVDDRSHD